MLALLSTLGGIWPEGETLNGVSIGDVGYHPAVKRNDITNGILPFHKLSQWMAYSMIEPFEEAGVNVIELDGLTGLAEYRNGGLFIDTKTLALKNQSDLEINHHPKSTLIVEWRALTIVLLDKVAEALRRLTGQDESTLPLASVLQCGTWTAGRRIALETRSDGSSPIKIISKGTIF